MGDEVRFTAKLSAKGKKAKWYMRNQECYKGPKFGFENSEDTFTLIIKKPETGDTGRYTCIVRECNDLSCKGYLEVEPADPEFGFCSKLKDKKGKTKRKVQLKCKVDDPNARVKWFKIGKEGANETSCKVEIEEFQHAFTSKLKGKKVVE